MPRLSLLLFLTACADVAGMPLPEGDVVFAPQALDLEGWRVAQVDVDDLTCPDGRSPRIYIVSPVEAPAAMPVALVLHGGVLDAVQEPSIADPLQGHHFASPDRLSRDWSVRAVFAFLGMEDDGRTEVPSSGALAGALAEQHVAMVLPANCWGDLWANGDSAPNDTEDGFDRSGLDLATITLDQLDGGALGVDPTETYLVGAGFGARGAAELLHAGRAFDGLLVDSASDDLATYWADPLYADTAHALERVFPQGAPQTTAHTLASASLPPRALYLWSSLDPVVPARAHEAALAAFTGLGATSRDTGGDTHEYASTDLEVARQAVSDLLGASKRRVVGAASKRASTPPGDGAHPTPQRPETRAEGF